MRINLKIRNVIGFLFIAIFILAIFVGIKALQNSQLTKTKASNQYDLKSYYPDTQIFNRYYLDGFNYVTSTPSRAVLWFEQLDNWTYKMYNSAPGDKNSKCHWDQLSWWDDGYLRYVKTHDECPGHTPNEIVYDPPIILLPRFWGGNTDQWAFNGISNATYYENGVLKCKGVNNYTGKILGLEQIAPGVETIHWNTKQTTSWASGNITGKCYSGYTTRWQEDYWLYSSLPIQNGQPAKGLKRTKGGNLDIQTDTWDIWFDAWKLLPKILPTPITPRRTGL